MAKTYHKNIRRTLAGTRSRFFAIFAIVALGVGFLAGLLSTSPDIADSMEAYLDGQNLYDFRVVSTLGLTDADLDAVRAVAGVAQVRGACSAELLAQVNEGDTLVARAHSIPMDEAGGFEDEGIIDRLKLIEGRWPESPGECVVEGGGSLAGKRLQPGDSILLTADNADLDEKMSVTAFTVVGVVRDSYYFSYEREPASIGSGSVGIVFYALPQDFAYDGVYTELYGTVEGTRALGSMSDEYKDLVSGVTDRVEAIAGGRCAARYEQVRADAQAEIDDAWQEYHDAEAEATEKLADAQAELEDGRRAWQDGDAELSDAEHQYQSGRTELADNEALVDEGLAAIGAAGGQLTGGLGQIYESLEQIEAGEQELKKALAELRAGQAQYEAGLAEWNAGRDAYESGLEQYIDGLARWQAGKAEYDAGLAAYEQGAAGLEQLRQLNAAQKGLDAAAAAGVVPAMYSDAAIAGLEEAYALKAVYDPYKAARDAYEAARQQAEDAGVADPDNDPAVQPLKAEYDRQRDLWVDALVKTSGGTLDPKNPVLVEFAEQAAVAAIEQLPPPEQFEQLRQLNAAQKGLETGIAVLIATGAAGDEVAARALFSDEGIAAAQQQLNEAKTLLDQNGPVLEQSKAELDAALTQLTGAKAQITAGKAELDAAKAELDAGWAQYYQGAAELAEGRAALEAARRTLDEGMVTLIDKQLQLSGAQKQIAAAKDQLADAKAQIAEGRATLEEKLQELLDGETDFADARAEVDAELADARAQIEDAQRELDGVEEPEWYVWSRQSNVSFASFHGNVNKVAALAKVFPVFFFLVAALVVLTTMTRMVEEERLQIGTMKALGYSRATIMSKYLLYSMTAAFAGALVGLALGFTVFPAVIWYAYEMMYYAPHFSTPWRWNYAILSGGSLILCALLATVSACRATMREVPAALMRPRAPKAGKRVFLEHIRPLWRRLTFTQKVTVRNLFRYKKRFWMTVIGVAGCTALLVTGFGISDSINGIIKKQYGGVCTYDLMTTLRTPEDTAAGPAHDALFGGTGGITQSLTIMMEKTSQEMPDGTLAETYLMCPADTGAFGAFMDLHERTGRRPVPLGESGAVITEKLAEKLGVKAGDAIELKNGDGKTGTVTVQGVCENYVSNYVYLGAAQYEQCFGKAPEWNAVLSLLAQDDADTRGALSARLLALDAVTSVTFTVDTTQSVLNMLSSINAVVVMVVVCAALLALVVLYNLSNINIAERVKEIATIKVLGFYDREVNAYVNRESVALTVIGALAGLALGVWLHRFVIYTVEVDEVMFGRTIDFSSYVYALVLTMLFSAGVNLFMGRKLKKVSMVESMKAPE